MLNNAAIFFFIIKFKFLIDKSVVNYVDYKNHASRL